MLLIVGLESLVAFILSIRMLGVGDRAARSRGSGPAEFWLGRSHP